MNLAPAELMLRFPGGSLWDDENLIRFGFMTPQDTGVWVRQLEDLGFVFYDKVDSGFVLVTLSLWISVMAQLANVPGSNPRYEMASDGHGKPANHQVPGSNH